MISNRTLNAEFKGVQLKFDSVTITSVPPPKPNMAPASWKPSEPKVILDNVSGGVNPGHFVSIIGASGKIIFLRTKALF